MAIAPAPVAVPAAPAPATPAPSAPPASSGTFLVPQNPATSGQNDLPMPAAMALPASTSTSGDTSTSRKFYTLSASLREIYDDNVSTSSNGAKSSLETDLSPSVLVDFPNANGDLSGRYTLGLTYYSHSPNDGGNGSTSNSSGGNNQGELQISHEFVAQYTRAFSDRFNLGVGESFRYYTEPSILQSTGTNYQNGAYIANILSANFSAQITPLFSSTSTFSDTVVRYDNSFVALEQNNIENTGSSTLGYAILPKITLNIGGILDNVTYQSSDRGYTSYTAFGGASWQALPSLTFSGRGGATFSQTGQATGQSSSQSQLNISPYAAFDVSWTLGERSSLGFSYAHEITPSDQVGANGQESDRLNANFRYLITPRLTANLDGVLTIANYSNSLANSATASYEENSYEIDTSLGYQYTSNFSFDGGLIFSGVSSNIDNNNYGRDEAYVGVRGTY